MDGCRARRVVGRFAFQTRRMRVSVPKSSPQRSKGRSPTEEQVRVWARALGARCFSDGTRRQRHCAIVPRAKQSTAKREPPFRQRLKLVVDRGGAWS